MASEKQKAASRANGAKSRGPVTPEGKLRARRSNLERGMLARTVVLEGESLPRFHALMASLHDELKPETPIENLLLHKMAVAHWRLMRVWAMERSTAAQALHDSGPCEPDAPARDALTFAKSGAHFTGHEMRFDRQFTRALDRFERFRASRTRQMQQTKAPEANHEPGN